MQCVSDFADWTGQIRRSVGVGGVGWWVSTSVHNVQIFCGRGLMYCADL